MLLAVAFGLLLPLPLGYLLKETLYGSPILGGAQGQRISPMLSLEERRRLVTFDRACRGSEDCEAPLGCLQDLRRFSRSVCIGSECELDSHCPEGQSCRVLKTQGAGNYCGRPAIRETPLQAAPRVLLVSKDLKELPVCPLVRRGNARRVRSAGSATPRESERRSPCSASHPVGSRRQPARQA
jgi:hypothetical protein